MLQLKSTSTLEEVTAIYQTPILDLIYQAATVHREHHNSQEIQVCTLLSLKTGACPEDCSYCSQSARYDTNLERQKFLKKEEILKKAKQAKESGSTRFCMGAAWREVKNNREFEVVLETVREVSDMGLEVCTTLGMLNQEQAVRLKEAGLTAYNHNLDTSEHFYPEIITTRTYQSRLDTIKHIGKAGISLCCGGILGLGESTQDRIDLLYTLTQLETEPESIPINALVPIPGTPLENNPKVEIWEMARMIATTRILFPKAMVRLAAGRDQLNKLEHAICFLAGANSIFSGDQLLTTPHPGSNKDQELFDFLSLQPKISYQEKSC